MTKRYILFMAFAIGIVIAGYHIDVQAEDQARKKIQKYADIKTIGEIWKVETFSIVWNSTADIPSPDSIEDMGTHMICYNPYRVPLCNALKKYEYKKASHYDEIKVIMKFYDLGNDKVLELGLARWGGVLLINGEAYEPSSEMMQALKYFMPYQTYEEVSQSNAYYKYFKNVEDKEKNANSAQSDPNSVNK